jgi:hypothetical protein
MEDEKLSGNGSGEDCEDVRGLRNVVAESFPEVVPF